MSVVHTSRLAVVVALWGAGCTSGPPLPELQRVEPDTCNVGVETAITVHGRHFHPVIHGDLSRPERAELDDRFVLTLVGETAPYRVREVKLISSEEISGVVADEVPVGSYRLELLDPRGRRVSLAEPVAVVSHQQFTEGPPCSVGGDCADDPCAATNRCSAGFCVYDKDADGDGRVDAACGGDDCDDDPLGCGTSCFPGNREPDRCDGADNDCDGLQDEDPDLIWYADADGDGFGDPLRSQTACTQPPGYVVGAADCADSPGADPGCNGLGGALCNPGLTGVDVCDGADNDCDGEVDEDHVAPLTSCGIGACGGNTGLAFCRAGAELDTCDPLAGSTPEAWAQNNCDNGVDDDCDGIVDDYEKECWAELSCTRRMALVFDNSQSSETLVDFPVSVRLSGARVDYGDFAFDGSDLRIVAPDGVTGLPHEIEHWDATGTSTIWTAAGTIPAGTTQDRIWMYYGCADLGSEDPAALWQSYAGVWHLAEPAVDEQTSSIHGDAAGNGNDGAQTGNRLVPGHLAAAQYFETDDRIEIDDSPTLDITGPITLAAWVRLATPNTGYTYFISKYDNGDNQRSYALYLLDMQLRFVVSRDGSDASAHVMGDTDLSPGVWHYVVGTWDGTSNADALKIYLDAALVGEALGPSTPIIHNSPTKVLLGCKAFEGTTRTNFLNGDLDEVRITPAYRTADWVLAQYLAMQDSFISYGVPEAR